MLLYRWIEIDIFGVVYLTWASARMSLFWNTSILFTTSYSFSLYFGFDANFFPFCLLKQINRTYTHHCREETQLQLGKNIDTNGSVGNIIVKPLSPNEKSSIFVSPKLCKYFSFIPMIAQNWAWYFKRRLNEQFIENGWSFWQRRCVQLLGETCRVLQVKTWRQRGDNFRLCEIAWGCNYCCMVHARHWPICKPF